MTSMTKKTGYRLVSLLLLVSVLMVNLSFLPVQGEDDLNSEIRVGLTTYHEKVSSILINNTTLYMGYETKDGWMSEATFTSTNGFNFIPAVETMLVSKEFFYLYDEAFTKVNLLREQGYRAYPGSAAPGIWKIYVGDGSNDLKAALDTAFELTYEVVGDTGHRMYMELSSTYPIVLYNSYRMASFSSGNLVNYIPLLNLGGRSYRGKVEIGRYGRSNVTAVNILPMQEYLYGVLPAEMISTWPIEALKAQAVAARNYAMYYKYINPKYPSEPYDVCDTINSQVYKGYTVEKDSCNQAVDATAGKLIYFEENIIPAYFFSTSGGHTEASENVWSGKVPYLKGVPDIFEIEPEKVPWVQAFTAAELKSILESKGVSIGSVTDVQVLGTTDAGRALSLKIIGTEGSYELVKETMRYWTCLKSRKFTLVKSGDTPKTTYTVQTANGVSDISYNSAYVVTASGTVSLNSPKEQLLVMSSSNIKSYPMISGQASTYIFVGQGNGHGVGMSQSGAKGMALMGYNYEEILEYYYTGTDVR